MNGVPMDILQARAERAVVDGWHQWGFEPEHVTIELSSNSMTPTGYVAAKFCVSARRVREVLHSRATTAKERGACASDPLNMHPQIVTLEEGSSHRFRNVGPEVPGTGPILAVFKFADRIHAVRQNNLGRPIVWYLDEADNIWRTHF